MEDILDIYDSNTFRLVKADVKLTKKGTHKDLTGYRYVVKRRGSNADPIDHDAMIGYLHLLRAELHTLRQDYNAHEHTEPDGKDTVTVLQEIPKEYREVLVEFAKNLQISEDMD